MRTTLNSQAEDYQTMTFKMHKKTVSVRTLAVVRKYIVVNGVYIAIICMCIRKYNTMAKSKNVLLHLLIAKVQYSTHACRKLSK